MKFRARISPFAGLTFINCFAAAMAHLEGYDSQEAFFWFDTACGRSAMRCRCDGEMSQWQTRICEHDFYDGGAEENIDFLFRLAGYEYRTVKTPSEFRSAAENSIGADRPVIAKVCENGFRVIIGVENGEIVCSDLSAAQNCPDHVPDWSGLECLYLIGEKTGPKVSPAQAMARVFHVLKESIDGDFWTGFSDALTAEMNCAERAAMMERISNAMRQTFNCHNLAEVFRARKFAGLSDARFDSVCEQFVKVCSSTHDLASAIIELNRCADWTHPSSKSFCGMVALTLEQLRRNDVMLLTLAHQTAFLLDRMEKEIR